MDLPDNRSEFAILIPVKPSDREPGRLDKRGDQRKESLKPLAVDDAESGSGVLPPTWIFRLQLLAVDHCLIGPVMPIETLEESAIGVRVVNEDVRPFVDEESDQQAARILAHDRPPFPRISITCQPLAAR